MKPIEPPPCCRQCGKKLKPMFKAVYTRVETTNVDGGKDHTTRTENGELLGYGYAGRGHFCTLSCGWRFAVDAVEGTAGTPGGSL